MNAHPDSDRRPADGDPVERLVRLAGPHEPIPPERLERLKGATRVAWQAEVRARRRRTKTTWVAAAFGAAAVVLLAVLLRLDRTGPTPTPLVEVATVQHVRGTVARRSVRDAGGDRALRADDRLYTGDSLTTSFDGLLAVRLATGVFLRLDRGTRLHLASTSVVTLDEGAIYVVSNTAFSQRGEPHGARPSSTLEISTRLGLVRDIGTRFEVRLQDALHVRVRDGLVSIDGAPPVSAGTHVIVTPLGDTVHERVNRFGPEWAWTTALASPFTLEGRSLREFLDWVSSETGLQIRFARSSDEQKAATLTLHGSIESLRPEQALDAVLPASGVDHAVADGVLTIRSIAEAAGR